MSDNKLVLHPTDPRAILQDPPQLVESLRVAGFIGAGFSHSGELHYRAGPRFRDLILFRRGAPSADAVSHHVSLLETTEAPIFLGAANAQPPACPVCQAKLSDWKEQLLEWQTAQQWYLWSCLKCPKKLRVEELVWGDTGGIARYSLDVWNIHEGEAVPSGELLAFLESETFTSWRHFYYRF